MSLTSRKARALTVAGIAAVGFAGASASGAQAASKTLTYSCTYPLIGAQPLSVDIDAALPDTLPAGTPSDSYAVTAKATAGGQTAQGLGLVGAKSVEGTATAGATVHGPGGDQPVTVPTTLDPYTPPDGATELTLTASGQTPSITVPEAGTATITVDSLNLNLTAKDADGKPIVLGTADDSDADPNTFDVDCTLDPADQDTTLATVTVS